MIEDSSYGSHMTLTTVPSRTSTLVPAPVMLHRFEHKPCMLNEEMHVRWHIESVHTATHVQHKRCLPRLHVSPISHRAW